MARGETGLIRNIALVGHEHSGKTTLAENFLEKAGVIGKMGYIKQKNTVSDWDPDEKDAEKSFFSSTLSFPYKGLHFNLLDVPGALECISKVLTALHAVECAVICVDAAHGVKANTRRTWQEAANLHLPRTLCVTRLNAENADFGKTLDDINKHFGDRCIPLLLPDGSAGSFTKVINTLTPPDGADGGIQAINAKLIESIVEADEALMERYLEGKGITEEELSSTISKALIGGTLFPVFATAAEAGTGTAEMLDMLAKIVPPPDAITRKVLKNGKEISLDSDGNGFVGFVYKSISDEFVTRISHIRILSGKLAANGSFVNGRSGKTEKYGGLYRMLGKDQTSIPEAVAGDIVAVNKLEDMHAGDTVTGENTDMKLAEIRFPLPMVSIAIKPKNRRDEQKIGTALKEMEGDDMTFEAHHEEQTHELVISGMSDLHLNLMLKRLQRKRHIEVETSRPRIPYKETITRSIKGVEYTHKKQSGGAGQFARVMLDMEPLPRGSGYQFEDRIVGGVIDQNFRPSVDKGIQAKMAEGVLAGYPVTDVKVSLVDGKTHPVDSKDIAFQIAGREAFKKGFMECAPIILEPVMKMEISAPAQDLGDIIGDMNQRRGRILSSDSEGSLTRMVALVPLAEIRNYQADLKSLTGGEGSYTIEFDHYDVVPANLQKEIIEQQRKEET